MNALTVWQNEAHQKYHHSQDETYLVRTPSRFPQHQPGDEWSITSPSDIEGATPYKIPGRSTREEAILFAAEYTMLFPSVPVRVERVTLTPDFDERASIRGFTVEECREVWKVATAKRLDAERDRILSYYDPVETDNKNWGQHG